MGWAENGYFKQEKEFGKCSYCEEEKECFQIQFCPDEYELKCEDCFNK